MRRERLVANAEEPHSMVTEVERLAAWYRDYVSPFLSDHDPERVRELDQDLDRLLRANVRASEELAICFLGASGVGKSTLINALVADAENVLPAGGIGPLTALAMQVRYGTSAAFEVDYHSPTALRQVWFGFEQAYIRRSNLSVQIEPEATVEIEEPEEPALEGDEAEARFEAAHRRVNKLVTGNQDSNTPVPYLLDRIRELSGLKPKWGTTVASNDVDRMQRLRSALERGRKGLRYRRDEGTDRAGFMRDLEDHASGFLAPIIREVHVLWPSPLLRVGITLVDLPGVGVAGDVYKAVTRAWIVEKARAVVLVVDNRGVREPDAELLRRSDFLTRLLFSIDDPKADPAALVAAVTQLDSPAEDRYYKDRTKRKREHLADVSADAISLVRNQMRTQLLSAWSRDGQMPRASHERIVGSVVDRLRVFPVTAFEFRKLLRGDEDDPSFITEPAQSGIPQMRAGLEEIAAEWLRTTVSRRDDAAKSFLERVFTTLEHLEARWQQDDRASEEAEALRSDLVNVLAPMREEFRGRQGEFRGFLRNEIPQRITALVSDASQEAHQAIRKYLRGLESAHWATLRAAVTRDGTFSGARYINLPDDFSQMFVEPIAEVWGEQLLQAIRKRTRMFTDDCIGQLEELAEWCRGQGARVKPKLIETHIASIRADTKQVNLVGKEAISDLREKVKNQLKVEIEKPIRKRCREFVAKGDHMGPGVKRRILFLFDELSDTSTTDARPVAEGILKDGFKNVDEELRGVMKSFEDPLAAAADAIASSHEDQIKRSDAQKRKGVLTKVSEVMRKAPQRAGMGQASEPAPSA